MKTYKLTRSNVNLFIDDSTPRILIIRVYSDHKIFDGLYDGSLFISRKYTEIDLKLAKAVQNAIEYLIDNNRIEYVRKKRT